MMERRGPIFRIADRGPLDTSGFHARSWVAEKVNARDDGRNQVLFAGISVNRNPALRLVLYDPRTRQGYSLSIETDSRTGQTRRLQWSQNTADSRVAAYRVVLRERARAIIGRGLRGL